MFMQDFQGLAKEIGHVIDVVSRAIEVTREIFKPILDALTLIFKPLYYLLDDIAVWLLGGQSVIGDVINGKLPNGKEIKELIKDAVGNPFKNFADSIMKNYNNPWWSQPFKGIFSPIDRAYEEALSKANMPKFLQTGNNTKVMQNDIKINVGSVSDGYEMGNQMNYTLNSLMTQF